MICILKNTEKHYLQSSSKTYNPANIRLDENVLKTSFVFVFRRRLQDVLIKKNIFAWVIRLQKTSSTGLQDVLVKTNIFVLAIFLEEVLQTSWKRLEEVFRTSYKNVFKASSRHLAKAFLRRLAKSFCSQDVLKTSSRRFPKISSGRFQRVSSS